MVKLHLGCAGKRIMENKDEWINIDINPVWQPDICWDLEKGIPTHDILNLLKKPLPWHMPEDGDNLVDEIVVFHTLEHLRNWVYLMKDIHEVCKNGALIHVKVPRAPTKFAFQDPTHFSFFTEDTFKYFDEWKYLYQFPYFKVLKVEDTKNGEEMNVELQVCKEDKKCEIELV